jgi:hypothetical protein
MKVTVILPDTFLRDIHHYAKGKNPTESIIKALSEWCGQKRIHRLNDHLSSHPLEFLSGFSASRTRKNNRKS